jgi:hypothetical protein
MSIFRRFSQEKNLLTGIRLVMCGSYSTSYISETTGKLDLRIILPILEY